MCRYSATYSKPQNFMLANFQHHVPTTLSPYISQGGWAESRSDFGNERTVPPGNIASK
jgi:hypothetical protein